MALALSSLSPACSPAVLDLSSNPLIDQRSSIVTVKTAVLTIFTLYACRERDTQSDQNPPNT